MPQDQAEWENWPDAREPRGTLPCPSENAFAWPENGAVQ